MNERHNTIHLLSRAAMDSAAPPGVPPATPSPAPQLAPSPAPPTSAPTPLPIAPAPAASTSAPAPKRYQKKPKQKKIDGLLAYTTSFVPGTYNVKIPAGDYLQKERNVDVARHISLERAKREQEEEKAQREEAGIAQQNPLSNILIIHPGSRNLRIGLASSYYPREVPNCIARPTTAVNASGANPVPALGSRVKKIRSEGNKKRKREEVQSQDVSMDGGEEAPVDPVIEPIGYLRDYLRNRLVQERLTTDWRDTTRVKAANAKTKPELLPEHNDPYRVDWTEPEGKPFFIGNDALRLPENAGYTTRFPILHRTLNRRDWSSSQSLLDDISAILTTALLTELEIPPSKYSEYSVLFIVPDHGDRIYVQEMTHLILKVLGFKAIAVQQEAYCAIFGAGMSSACVVDIGAQQTSVTCVDEAVLQPETRMKLHYGGDDITSSLAHLLEQSSFPYRDLDLARAQDFLMMDNLKMKICTLEEHLVANTPWDFFVPRTEGLTQKWALRTFDENILAPLVFFDTRLIDFEEKKGQGSMRFWNTSDDKVSDEISSNYEEPTGAMRACTSHLLPAPVPIPPPATESISASSTPAPPPITENPSPEKSSTSGTPAPDVKPGTSSTPTPVLGSIPTMASLAPLPTLSARKVFEFSAHSPLDAAIAASIGMAGTENKMKSLSQSILLIGGSSNLKGLSAFIAERLPSLLRQKGGPGEVTIVPPPRGLNPKFVSWKGGSVMCHIESLQDMWIRRDEWEATGIRALKDRYMWF
ncbi:hypothetical protein L202_00622 [Cryptococcus amylolentus CBS 6039]|uniref:Uncharacterized protein n=1 Tax=Cryptococcus amylolentus CBS 6039 TaxID=1295533 RepID=A0A1E3I855_9TREE|nr:hypothetical protein L202_00622 [Cryptococcus amylolentus CBS 6039]ODN84742.1 hypothetical protein L202_00622 [Cryptococcus amylolentus CBS 6039]